MALKIYDTMKPQGDYPAVKAEDVEMSDGSRLSAFNPVYPVENGKATLEPEIYYQFGEVEALAVTLTAIDLKKYSVVSMSCYIGMGWCIIIAIRQLMQVLALPGVILLVAGGVTYTIGSVLYGIGKKHRYVHSIFHFFVLIGSILQALCIILYVIG